MKKPRPAALPSVTMRMPTRCGKIYVTVTVDGNGLPFETFVRFGKAGHCGAAIFDATTKLLSYALRSGMDPHEAVKALGGIGCHCGTVQLHERGFHGAPGGRGTSRIMQADISGRSAHNALNEGAERGGAHPEELLLVQLAETAQPHSLNLED